MDNPLFLANRKAKKLKTLLAHPKACRDIRFPYLDALVFCSNKELDCRLYGPHRLRICLRDTTAEAGRPGRAGILAALRRREAEGLSPTPMGQFDAPRVRAISRAMEQAGNRQSQRGRRVGDYRLAKLLFENPLNLYQDWEAEHFQLPSSKRFVRLYLAAASTSSTERETLKRAARREYEILDSLRQQNILLVQQYTQGLLKFRWKALIWRDKDWRWTRKRFFGAMGWDENFDRQTVVWCKTHKTTGPRACSASCQ